MITIEPPSSRSNSTPLAKSGLTRFLRRARGAVGLEGEVEVLLTSDTAIKRLNRDFRGKNKATDVLSFPAPEEIAEEHAGDLAISLDTAARQAASFGHSLGEEVRVLIRLLAQENFDWGAPKIHGELQKLGFLLSERTVARYLRRIQRRGDPGKKWLAFLHNHSEAIVAFDLFTVPSATFRVWYCFFVIEPEPRRILHFNVTRHPSAIGSCNSCVKPLRRRLPIATPFWITMRSSTLM